MADYAAGSVLVADGNPAAALAVLRRASIRWRELDMPYEAARARVSVAVACRAVGDHDAATLELDAASATFERIGARPDLDRTAQLAGACRRARPRAPPGLTDRPGGSWSELTTPLGEEMVRPVDAGPLAGFYRGSSRHGGKERGMSKTGTIGIDTATVERLSTAFNRCFETLEVGDDLFTPDAFFELAPPFWRFQLQGPDAFVAQLRAVNEGEAMARILRVIPTTTGFVMEHEETRRGTKDEVARRLWLCEIRDGRISDVVGYCNGGWDEALRARHAAEAPMLRP